MQKIRKHSLNFIHFIAGEDPTFQQGKYGNPSHGASLQSRFSPLPQISSRSQKEPRLSQRNQSPSHREPRLSQRSQSPSQNYHPSSNSYQQNSQNSHSVVRASSPRDFNANRDSVKTNRYDKVAHLPQHSDWDDAFNVQSVNNYDQANLNKPRHHETHSDRAYQDYRQPVASSPKRVPVEPQQPQEEYLQPLSATPPNSPEGEGKQTRREKKPQNNEDSGIAGFTPDVHVYRVNQDEVLDR